MKNKNLKESITDISTLVKSPPAKNPSKAVSTSTISTSTSAKEASSSSSSISLIPSSTPTLSTSETVSRTTAHGIFTKHMLNRNKQTSNEIQKNEFSHFTNVTNLQLKTSVTRILSNLSVEIPPKVSISTGIFNISEVSILAKVNETWPEEQADGVTRTIQEQPNTPTTVPSRHKRSFQGENRRSKN